MLPEGIFNMLWYFMEERLKIVACSFSQSNEPVSKRKSCSMNNEVDGMKMMARGAGVKDLLKIVHVVW